MLCYVVVRCVTIWSTVLCRLALCCVSLWHRVVSCCVVLGLDGRMAESLVEEAAREKVAEETIDVHQWATAATTNKKAPVCWMTDLINRSKKNVAYVLACTYFY